MNSKWVGYFKVWEHKMIEMTASYRGLCLIVFRVGQYGRVYFHEKILDYFYSL